MKARILVLPNNFECSAKEETYTMIDNKQHISLLIISAFYLFIFLNSCNYCGNHQNIDFVINSKQIGGIYLDSSINTIDKKILNKSEYSTICDEDGSCLKTIKSKLSRSEYIMITYDSTNGLIKKISTNSKCFMTENGIKMGLNIHDVISNLKNSYDVWFDDYSGTFTILDKKENLLYLFTNAELSNYKNNEIENLSMKKFTFTKKDFIHIRLKEIVLIKFKGTSEF